MRTQCLICSVAMAVAMTACSNAPAPSADTRAADVQAVKDVEAAWIKVIQSKDLEKSLSYFADDAVGLYSGMAALNGKQALKEAFTSILADPNYAVTFQNTRMEASKGGDLVYSLGTYTMTLTNPKTKKPATDKGKYLTIYQKQADGNWKALVDSTITDSSTM
jgi:uncharacterized protein (TIGR02246 family)